MTSIARLRHLWPGAREESLGRSEQAGVLAMAAFGFLAFQGHAGAKFGLLCLLLVTLFRWRDFLAYARRDPLFHLVCLLAVYLGVRAWSGTQLLPGTGWRQLEAAIDLGVVGFGVVMLSWWLRADTRRVILLVALAIAGLSLEIVLDDLQMADVNAVLAGDKRGMLGSALARALISALGLLILVATLPVLLGTARQKSRAAALITLAGAVLIGTLLGLVQVITQSRAVIGLFAVLAVFIVAVHVLRALRERRGAAFTLASALVPLVVLGAVTTLVGGNLASRLDHDLDSVLPYIGQEDLSEMPRSSLSWRVQLVDLGLEVGSDRPWFGWGAGTSAIEDLVHEYDRSHLSHLHHLHNSPLEIWVRLGVVGIILYSLSVVLVVRALVSGARNSRAPPDLIVALGAGIVLFAGYVLIEFRMLAWDFNSAVIMLAAVAYTFGPNRAHVEP